MAFWNTDKDYYNKAQKLFEKKYDKECLSAALENIQKAVSKNPEEAKYYALQGAIEFYYYTNKSFAIKNYTTAIQKENITSEKAEYLYDRAMIYTGIKKYNAALQDINQAIELCENNFYYWDLFGDIQKELEKYSDAKNSYYTALSKFKNDSTPDYQNINKKIDNITKLIDKRIEEYYTQGKKFYDNKIYPEAIEQFEQAILLNPDDANVYYFMADSEYRVTQYDKAIKYINIGITKKPNDLYHYYKLSGWIKEEKNDLENAKQDYIKALENNPDRDAKEELERDLKEIEYKINIEKAEEYYQKSKLEFKKKEYSKTIDLIQKAIIAKSDNPDYWYWLARAYYKLESWNNVIENLNAGIALKPMDIFHYYHLRAGAKVETEDIEGAVADYKEALKHNPDKITYNKINKSLILTEDKINTKKAEEYFDEGAGLYDNKNYGEAIKCLEKACELNNKNPDYFYWCGLAYYSNNDYDNAIEKFEKACVLDENDADNFYWLALAYSRNKEYENARIQIEKGIDLKPDDIYYYYDLAGDIAENLLNTDKSINYYKLALDNSADIDEDNITITKNKLAELTGETEQNSENSEYQVNNIEEQLSDEFEENDNREEEFANTEFEIFDDFSKEHIADNDNTDKQSEITSVSAKEQNLANKYIAEGFRLMENRKALKAKNHFYHAINKDPNNSNGYYGYAKALFRLNQQLNIAEENAKKHWHLLLTMILIKSLCMTF